MQSVYISVLFYGFNLFILLGVIVILPIKKKIFKQYECIYIDFKERMSDITICILSSMYSL